MCRIKYESFSYASDQMKLAWMDRDESKVFQTRDQKTGTLIQQILLDSHFRKHFDAEM